MIRIGLISDTHGLLRPEAKAFLSGSDLIIHAGDIGNAGILAELRLIAPVTAVRGNNDGGPWAEALEETELMRVGDFLIYTIHDLAQLGIEPSAAGIRAVVSGHSHKPRVEERGGVLFVNPGSAGPRRFTPPIAAGEIIVHGATISARTVELVSVTCADSRSPAHRPRGAGA
ncbi:MAG: metallophosphoesterase family protein [Steroidobacteraceae bacterium]|jgi:putative phosphoesterase